MAPHKVHFFPDEAYFKDKLDPTDSAFRIVEIRMPHESTQVPYGPYGPYEYRGVECRDRLVRFAAAYLAGFGYLTVREAEKIMRKHPRQGDN